MNLNKLTKEYYAKWIGTDIDSLDKSGVFWIYNPLRNETPVGYPYAFDIFTFITQNTIIISYGDKAKGKINDAEGKITLGMSIEKIKLILREVFLSEPGHNIKYIYTHDNEYNGNSAKRLTSVDYEIYLNFFKAAHPNCKDLSWVKDYFLNIADKGYCHGVFVNGQLVSATDAPSMPFMSDLVQEIGINTLSDYQGNGYGKSSCLSCIKNMISNNICPQWSTTSDNIASQRLAISVGFDKYFDNLSLQL